MPEHSQSSQSESTEVSLRYKRAKFFAHLPRDRRYAASHYWMQHREAERWRVGFTPFALRMLGEPVEVDFELENGTPLEAGQLVGWMEGFKAVTDLYAPMSGTFRGMNPSLGEDISAAKNDPYGRGWLYELDAPQTPGGVDASLDADGYAGFLDGTIDRMMGEQG
jgi:glycine cleavage system H protein